MREVVQIHLLHLAGEQFVFHHHVKLPVSNPTRQIQIGGPTRAHRPSATAVLACNIGPFHSKTRTPASSNGRKPARDRALIKGTSVERGTSSRTSTPSVAAARRACTYAVVPTK